jgi:cytoskeletal protein RodZ
MPQINISTESLVAVGIVAVAVLGWTYARSAALTEPTSSTSTSANTATKKKGKKTKGKKSGEDTPGLATPPQESETPQPQKVTPPKIERSAPSFAQVAAPAAGSSDGGVLKPKTLAEKKATKPRKTKVDE